MVPSLWLRTNGANAPPPNILFILTDDQRNDTLGCAGHPVIKTPHIDRLAEGGVRFENAFVTTSICAASRASILTGVTERTHGYTFGKPPVPAPLVSASYPALLRAAGYRTGFFGKLGVNLEGGHEALFHEAGIRDRPYLKKQKDGSLRHIDEINLEQALNFIKNCSPGQPFCLSVSFSSAHAEDRDKENHYPNIEATQGMYSEARIDPPRLSDPAIFEALPDFLQHSMNRDRFFWRWDTPEKYDKNMRDYFGLISGVDHMVGRILAQLQKQGLADNTAVIYAGDNGYYMGDRGFAGKWSHFEQSLRVPLILSDPRLPEKRRGEIQDAMALNVDIPATILDLAGVQSPDHYQGRSLFAWTNDKKPKFWRDDFFCEHLMDHKSIPKWEGVRGERYVYARYFEQDPVFEFLHDLRMDPDELTNLAGQPNMEKTLATMRKRCDELRDLYTSAKP